MKYSVIILALALFTALALAGQCQDRCNDQYTIGLNMAGEYLQGKWYAAQERPGSVTSLQCPQWTYIFDFVEEGRLMAANQVCYHENRACHEACETGECGDNCEDVLMQQCCHNATLSFLAEAKANCLGQCGSETPTPTPTPTPEETATPTPSPTPEPTPVPCNFTKSVSNQGTVTVTAVGSETQYETSAGAHSTITFTQGQAQFLTVNIYESTQFRLSPCSSPQLSGREPGLLLDGSCGRTLQLSSEHSSIRGTINGGGDFIQRARPNDLGFDAPPPPTTHYGKVTVRESGQQSAPYFDLEVSLQRGRMRIASAGGYSEYSVEPYSQTLVAEGGNGPLQLDAPPPRITEGAVISVASGSVVVTNVGNGGSITLGEGETRRVALEQLAPPTPTPEPTGEAECETSADCQPGTEMCVDGKCVEAGPSPWCYPSFILLPAFGAAMVLAARKREGPAS